MSALTGRGDRLDYLHEAAAVLWPGATVTVTRDRIDSAGDSFLLLPHAHRPRLLVPASSRRAAASAVLGYGESSSPVDRWRARLLAAGLRSGAAQRLLRDHVHLAGGTPTLAAHLGEVLGTEVLVSLYLSAPRANRKPVLQLLDRRGRRLAFVKVGVDRLTKRLVRAETAALLRVAEADVGGLVRPAVLHSGQWHDLELLVQSALPLGTGRRPVPWSTLTATMRRVAHIDRAEPAELAGTAFWQELCTRVSVLADGPAAAGLAALLTSLHDLAARTPIGTGSWHGDWTPWNMASVGGAATPEGRLAVWDWERFGPGRPLGFDLLHYSLQRDLVARRRAPAEAVEHCLDGASQLLEPFGLTADTANITACCYLAELATRYTEDGQAQAGARLGHVQDWLLPGLRARIERCPR